jgi:hypothetical protein
MQFATTHRTRNHNIHFEQIVPADAAKINLATWAKHEAAPNHFAASITRTRQINHGRFYGLNAL